MPKNPIKTFTDTMSGKTTARRVAKAENYTDNRGRKMSGRKVPSDRKNMTREQRLKADVKDTFGY